MCEMLISIGLARRVAEGSVRGQDVSVMGRGVINILHPRGDEAEGWVGVMNLVLQSLGLQDLPGELLDYSSPGMILPGWRITELREVSVELSGDGSSDTLLSQISIIIYSQCTIYVYKECYMNAICMWGIH